MSQQMLIEELLPSSAKILAESSDDGKSMWLNGIFMQAETENRNKRVYPIHEVSAAVDRMNREITERNGIMGELDHPQSISINLDRVSHLIVEMRMEGNNAIGRAKLLNTPTGLIAQEIIKNGMQLGVSSRGTGSVNEGIVEGFSVVTIDIVGQPSAQGALPNSIYESLDTTKGKRVLTLAESLQHDDAAQKFFVKEFKGWMADTFK